jgi:hypothetical protein
LELSDGTKFVVHPDKLNAGGPPRDGIPSIDNPQYDVVEDADSWLEDNESLLFLNYNGVRKAYPLRIMTWHEIVNDYAAGIPVAITFCPLCLTGIAYERIIEVDGELRETELGTSGKLFNSNLVMYDRETESYWTQVDGIGIVRDYTRDPYLSYYTDDAVWFPVEFREFTVNTKEVVYGIEVNGTYKAYRDADITTKGIVDEVGGVFIEIKRENGVVNTTVVETGEELIEERHFWFSWYAFHPDTELYGE